MMRRDTYFSDMLRTDKLLKTHGFDRWPTEEEIVLHLLETNASMRSARSLGWKHRKTFADAGSCEMRSRE